MKINNKEISNDNKLTVFGGVNVIESDELLFQVAEKFKEISHTGSVVDSCLIAIAT